jgi:hypothetical protein
VDWVRPKLLVKNPVWITNNQPNIVVNFHQDLWQARSVISLKDRWIGAYSSGLTILGKLLSITQEENTSTF